LGDIALMEGEQVTLRHPKASSAAYSRIAAQSIKRQC
jgi:hypothetical protein